ncbi:hypothetical protein LWI28_013920 [Acer negundo]|uniref:Uncharacterized protein n=1 Tax=Acer negundo TaxID=4023 RepID=A0AAD5J5V9_ACENE|nr:hypothetical protein LWI28_013920 [Acer negundo]
MHPTILGDEAYSAKGQQLQAFAELGIRCVSESPENRPMTIISSCLRTIKYRAAKADKKTFLMKNGEKLLEKLIPASNGKYNPIRSFSANELKMATNNYSTRNVITRDRLHELFKGFLEDHRRPISVMKFTDYMDAYVSEDIRKRIKDSSRRETGGEYCLLDHVKKYNENGRLEDLIDHMITEDVSCSRKDTQLKAFTAIAFKCVSESEEERPTMIDVAKKLRQINV